MTGRFRDGVARWLRLRPPGRDVRVRADDLFLVSYPRSGNTWLRFVLTALAHPHRGETYSDIRKFVPDIYKESRRALDSTPSPRYLKSHEYFDPRYPRIVYLVRDPRDVAVSYFHQQKRLGLITDATDIREFVVGFIAGRADGFGRWDDHVESWLNTTGTRTESFYLVRYEEMLQDPERKASEVARFLSLPVGESQIAAALSKTSIERMKAAERAETQGDELPAHVTFVRKGGSGGWRAELDEADAKLIVDAFGPTMQKLGYLA